MIYSGRKLVMGLAFSAISKYIELVTSAEAEVGKSVGMVLEVGEQVVRALSWGLRTGWTRWRSGRRLWPSCHQTMAKMISFTILMSHLLSF
jgi:hypothetical protein